MRERYAIGLDLGGTHLRAGIVTAEGAVHGFIKRPSRVTESADAPLEVIERAVRDLLPLAGDDHAGVGLGCPGVIDPETGAQIGRTANLPHWEDLPLRDVLASRLGVPVSVDNDANLAALGEHRCGAARGSGSSITITIGTGVGCGIIAAGKIFHGARGGAGEIGHIPLGDGRLECRCEVEGCVEPEMSGGGLDRRAAEMGLEGPGSVAMFAAAERGDRRAVEVLDRFGDRLGAAIAIAVNLLNPDAVVIGGGVAEIGEPLISRVRESLGRYALESHRRDLRVVRAALGERAAVAGAGLLRWSVVADPRYR